MAKEKSTSKKQSSRKKKPTITVADNQYAAEYSAQLRKLRRTAADRQTFSGKKTIAARTAFRRQNRAGILSCLLMVMLLLFAGFFKFCLQGYGFSALVCTGIACILCFYTFFPRLKGRFPKFTKVVIRIVTIVLCIGFLIAGITEACIIKASFGNSQTSCNYLLVLGAKVRSDGPSLSLSNRINAAYDYLTAHPDTIAIVSGGQGGDEPISEAQCMYEQLTAKGIDPSRIWMEDQATSTWENLQYSLALIEEKSGARPTELAVLSSEYHLFRASLFAKAAGLEFYGVPARTTNPVLMVNYFLREIAGVWHYILLGSIGGHYNA